MERGRRRFLKNAGVAASAAVLGPPPPLDAQAVATSGSAGTEMPRGMTFASVRAEGGSAGHPD
jgi:hypothetical protein